MNPSRALNKDGTDNLDRTNLKFSTGDAYHLLLSVNWLKFFTSTILTYLIINFAFSIVYFTLGPEGFAGIVHTEGLNFFEECFFFSIQTFSTIGYGRVSPVGFAHNLTVSIEAFLGMLSIAVMSGLLFARFSKPTAKIRFSHNALITDHRGRRSLVFRLANARLNQIAEATLSVSMLVNYSDKNGTMRAQHDLTLLRNRSLIFAASWTAVHVIDESSPLNGKTLQDLKDWDAEIIVSMIGLDSTFSQTIHARHSYLWTEILEGKQFADILHRNQGRMRVDLEKISELR